EKLQPFPGEVLGKVAQPGGVATRHREGRHNSGADGIGVDRKYDRDRRGRLLQNQDCGRSPRHNDGGLEGDELGGQRREAIWSAFRRSELKDNVLAFNITDVMQPFPEGLNETGSLRAERGCKITYSWNDIYRTVPLLRVRCYGPRRHGSADKS